MIVLDKKKIMLAIAGVFILIIVVCVFRFSKNQKNVIPTVALPVSNKVIVLDAGHGRRRPEEVQLLIGLSEAGINLNIALKVQNLLEQAGSTVILTRSDDNGIYDLDKKTLREKKVSDIKNRVKIGNESEADIFVSIHMNKIPETQYWGWQTFFKKDDEKSKMLAKCLQSGLNETIQKENKRESLKIENVYIIEHVEIPTAIVECGFLSNEEEKELLKTNEYQDKLAWGIYIGIMDYFYQSNP